MNVHSFSGATELIGIIFTVIAILHRIFPPKRINPVYGYRSSSAMRNQETWDIANRRAATLSIVGGLFLTFVGFIAGFVPSLNQSYTELAVLLLIIVIGLIAFLTEKEIKKLPPSP